MSVGAEQRVGPDDRLRALGRLFRGIAHENANALNAVLMNAELAQLSAEEVPGAVRSMAHQARAGGEFLKRLLAFSAADDFAPQGPESVHECLIMTRRLLGSKPQRTKVAMSLPSIEDLPPVPLDGTGFAITMALLIDALCDARPAVIAVDARVAKGQCEIGLDIDGNDSSQSEAMAFAMRFARCLAADHGGTFEHSAGRYRLRLPAT